MTREEFLALPSIDDYHIKSAVRKYRGEMTENGGWVVQLTAQNKGGFITFVEFK